ncbi:hypothetical protein N7478_001165 [Penicillium angulare]|uniref:uncharacterized protein n=1 Tax=Penicillium angulare TaxID=116970 RepID=UPI00253FFE8D|nr:uncharacterized protein N7478_001165 [Penicillium angulare]KAJ5291914.1 hypothetical protein N7478_001165 [Penicillium angulare]
MIIDNSHTGIVINTIAISDHFWVFIFYDVYGHNYVKLGVVEGSSTGKYRVNYQPSDPGTEAGGVLDGYKGRVHFPAACWGLVAQLQLDSNGSNVDAIRQLQDKMAVTKPAVPNAPMAPSLTVNLLTEGILGAIL